MALEDVRYAIAYIIMMGGTPLALLLFLVGMRRRISSLPLGGWPILLAAYFGYRTIEEKYLLDLSKDYSKRFFKLMQWLIWPLCKKQGGGRILFQLPQDEAFKAFKTPHVFAAAPHPPGMPLFRLAFQGALYDLQPDYKAGIALGARIIFRVPGLRELYHNFALEGTPENFARVIQAGRSVSLMPGGVPESMVSRPGNLLKVVTFHTGFIRLALEHGVPIVPNFGLGENNHFEQIRPPEWLAQVINKFTGGWYPTLFKGSYFVIPNPSPVAYIVGKPVEMPRIKNPTMEDIEIHRVRFYSGMRDSVLQLKDEAGDPDIQVEFLGLPQLNINVKKEMNDTVEVNKEMNDVKEPIAAARL